MLNLRKRIKELVEKTSSLEAKTVCKEVLENFVNIPENQLSEAIVEKLRTISDTDKHVTNFLHVADKINAVNNLGVAKGIATIKESQIYSYPGLMYGLSKIESSLMYKQVRIVESDHKTKNFKSDETWNALNIKNNSFQIQENNVSGLPEYMLIDNAIGCIKNFIWDPTVESVYSELKKNRENLNEEIELSKSLYDMKSKKGSFFFDSIIPKLEEQFANPTESSRTTIIEDLKKLNFYPIAKNLSESLNRIQLTKKGGVQIVSDNSRCSVHSIYSPVLLENATEYFYARGNYYSKADGKIHNITNENAVSLPEKFREVCRIISSPNVFIKEGKISFYLKRDKVEIVENEKNIDVLFNGSKVTSNELAKNMVSAGLFRLEESQIAYDVQMVADSYSNIFDLDFGKIIESNIHQGSYVILMKDGDKIYMNKVNESSKSNEFFSDLSISKARNMILEFIGFDIKESLAEYLENDDVKINELKQSKLDIIKNIAIIESNLEKINSALNDSFMSNNTQLIELKKMLESEILTLKNKHRKVSSEITMFEGKTSSSMGIEATDEVKLKSSGESATVVSVDTSSNKVIVITASGSTKEVSGNEIVSIEADIEKSNAKNDDASVKESVNLDASSEEGGVADENEDEDSKKKSLDPQNDEVDNSTNYVKATVSQEQGGPSAGETVEVLASDYASKGDEELIEVKIGDDVVFIEKKFIALEDAPFKDSDDDENVEIGTKENTEEDIEDSPEEKEIEIDLESDDDDENDIDIEVDDEKDEPEPDIEAELDNELESKSDDEQSSEDETIVDEPTADDVKNSDLIIDDELEKEPVSDDVAITVEEPSVKSPENELEILRAKLQKSLSELEEIQSAMTKTFTSTDTIASTITSIKGMLDAMKNDHMNILNNR